MKNYLAGILAVLMAATLHIHSKATLNLEKGFIFYTFRFLGNPSIRSEVEDPAKWTQGLITCNGISAIPCSIVVPQEYTHNINFGDDGDYIKVLNTPIDNPEDGSCIIIQTVNGYLDTAPNPDVQYYKVTTGTGYSYQNKSF